MGHPHYDPRYRCHVFVCVNQRPEGRPSCGGSGGEKIREGLKERIKELGLNDRVRVSASLCLGACLEGPNVVIYPAEIWFHHTSADDIPGIVTAIESILAEPENRPA